MQLCARAFQRQELVRHKHAATERSSSCTMLGAMDVAETCNEHCHSKPDACNHLAGDACTKKLPVIADASFTGQCVMCEMDVSCECGRVTHPLGLGRVLTVVLLFSPRMA